MLDLKSSSEQIFSENGRWVPLKNLSKINKETETLILRTTDQFSVNGTLIYTKIVWFVYTI